MAAHPGQFLRAENIARTIQSALISTTAYTVNDAPAAGSNVNSIRDMMRMLDAIPAAAEGGSTAQVALRTALIAAMATAFATVAAQAVLAGALAIEVAAITP